MLTTGDKVRVFLPPRESSVSPGLRSYNGFESVVKEVRHYTFNGGTTYTLDGIVTEYGIPYEFFEEWLVPLDTESEETK